MKLRYATLLALILISISHLLPVQSHHFSLADTPTVQSLQKLKAELLWTLGRGTTQAVAWSPNGKFLAVGSSQGIWLYNSNFKELKHFEENVSPVSHLAWSPDSSKITDQAQIRDVTTGKVLASLEEGNSTFMDDLSWSPDGMMIVGAGFGEFTGVLIWDAVTGKLLIKRRTDPSNRILSVAWKPDSAQILVVFDDGSYQQLDSSTTKILSSAKVDGYSLKGAAWNPQGTKIATVAVNQTGDVLLVWNTLQDTKPSVEIPIPFVLRFVWSPDGKQIATDGMTTNDVYAAQIWDVASGNLVTATTHTGVVSLSWNSQTSQLAVAEYARIRIWDTKTGNLISTLDGYSAPIEWVGWNPVKNYLGVADDAAPYETRILNADTAKLEFSLGISKKGGNGNTGWSWSPDGNFLAAIDPDSLTLWNISHSTAEPSATFNNIGFLKSISWMPTTDKLSVINRRDGEYRDEGSMRILDIQTKKTITEYENIQHTVWSPKGKYVATYTGNPGEHSADDLQIRDAITFKILMTFNDIQEDAIHSDALAEKAVWSPDSEYLIGTKCSSMSGQCLLWKWDVTTGKISKPFKLTSWGDNNDNGGGVTNTLALSPDGKLVADSRFLDLNIWDVTTGELLTTISSNMGWIRAITWSPDSKKIATGSRDGSIRVWSIEYTP